MVMPGTETVYVVLREPDRDEAGKAVRDGYGQPVFRENQVPRPRCSVQPETTPTTAGDGSVLVETLMKVYDPEPGFPGQAGDVLLIRGKRWVIRGQPEHWPRPGRGHAVITAGEVSG